MASIGQRIKNLEARANSKGTKIFVKRHENYDAASKELRNSVDHKIIEAEQAGYDVTVINIRHVDLDVL